MLMDERILKVNIRYTCSSLKKKTVNCINVRKNKEKLYKADFRI